MLEVLATVLVLFAQPHEDGGGRDRIELHQSAREDCARMGGRDAKYVYRPRVAGNPALSNSVVRGCWAERGGFVYVVFDDGDAYRIPARAFKPRGI